jgi:hypothetical protein
MQEAQHPVTCTGLQYIQYKGHGNDPPIECLYKAYKGLITTLFTLRVWPSNCHHFPAVCPHSFFSSFIFCLSICPTGHYLIAYCICIYYRAFLFNLTKDYTMDTLAKRMDWKYCYISTTSFLFLVVTLAFENIAQVKYWPGYQASKCL